MNFSNTKSPGKFKFISLGDVHLGHHSTPTELIIRNLDRYCTNESNLKDVDLLVITGDLFDRLLENANTSANLIERWISRLLFKCSFLNVKIRIVEGTPAHDRKQSVFFLEQKENANIPVDVHYASTLSIEYIPCWDCNILYVPDAWRHHTSDTLSEVKTLLHNNQLDKVDFAIMHGAFSYQYPAVVPEPTHDPEQYLDLVKYYILIGHVHFMSQYKRILAAGSFDRINHGEEGPKGYFRVTMTNDHNDHILFVENKGAKKYITVDCYGLDIHQINTAIRKAVTEAEPGSAFRLKCGRHDAITGDMDAIEKQYPDYQWLLMRDTEKKKATPMVEILGDVDLISFIEITPSNLLSLIEHDIHKLLAGPDMAKRYTDASTESLLRRLDEIIKS